jgi:ABC-type sugar transport system, permease component
MKKQKGKLKPSSIALGVFTVFLVLLEVYPIFWLITASFKTAAEFSDRPSYALNLGFHWQNYADAWNRGNMSTFFKNSLINTLISLIFIVIFAITVGFALTKMEWKNRERVASFFSIGIMVPIATALIPLFQMYRQVNLINTRTGLIIVYVAFGLSLSIYLVTGYFRSLPDEILEAGVVDGCGIYRLLWEIVVPLMKNAIITVLVLQFFFKWNDLLFSMTLLNDTRLKTIQTGLLYFQDEFGSKNWGAIFASVSISVMPMLVLYMILNKTVMEGMTAGAVKG